MPSPHKATWKVWTSSEVFTWSGAMGSRSNGPPCWSWMAAGPRGFHAGCETTSGEAINRAVAACALVAESTP